MVMESKPTTYQMYDLICRYILSIYKLSLHTVVSLAVQRLYSLVQTFFSIFGFGAYAFDILSKKKLPR
jgi:hypothetical protein